VAPAVVRALDFKALPPLRHARSEPIALALEDGRTLVVGSDGWAWDEEHGWRRTKDLPPEVLAADRSGWSDASQLVQGRALRGVRGRVCAGEGSWSSVDRLPDRPAQGTLALPDGATLVVGGAVSLPDDESPGATARCVLQRAGAVRTFVLHRARIDPTLSLLEDGRVLVTGGYTFQAYPPDDSRQTPVRETELIDLRQQQVTLGGSLHKARFGHAVALHPGGELVIAGGGDGFLPGIDAAELGSPGAPGSVVTPFPPRE
jgi:hypothetical protein